MKIATALGRDFQLESRALELKPLGPDTPLCARA